MKIIDERETNNISTIYRGDTFIYEGELYICYEHNTNYGGTIIHCVNLKNGEKNKIWGGAVERVDVECHIIDTRVVKGA